MSVHSIRFGLTYSQVASKLYQQGFCVVGQKGSHVHFQRKNKGHKVTVPNHGSEEIAKGTLASIRRQVRAAGGNGNAIRFSGLNYLA